MKLNSNELFWIVFFNNFLFRIFTSSFLPSFLVLSIYSFPFTGGNWYFPDYTLNHRISHCVKCPYLELVCSAFCRNWTEYAVSLRIQSECGKMQTRITPNTDTFYAVSLFKIQRYFCKSKNTGTLLFWKRTTVWRTWLGFNCENLNV